MRHTLIRYCTGFMAGEPQRRAPLTTAAAARLLGSLTAAAPIAAAVPMRAALAFGVVARCLKRVCAAIGSFNFSSCYVENSVVSTHSDL